MHSLSDWHSTSKQKTDAAAEKADGTIPAASYYGTTAAWIEGMAKTTLLQ